MQVLGKEVPLRSIRCIGGVTVGVVGLRQKAEQVGGNGAHPLLRREGGVEMIVAQLPKRRRGEDGRKRRYGGVSTGGNG